VEDAALFRTAHDHILENASQFSVRSLSMAAWAFATVRFKPCRGLMSTMADVFAAGLQEDGAANPVTVTNMSWALATARVQVKKEALLTIADAAVAALKNFKAHELSITLWAFARLNSGHDHFFSQAALLLCTSSHLREDIHSQGIANLLWAFARHMQACQPNGCWHVSSKVLSRLMPTCLRLLPELRPLELASTVWAVTTLGIYWGQDPAADLIVEAIAKKLLFQPGQIDRLSPHCLNGVLAAYCGFFGYHTCTPSPVCIQLVAQLSLMGATQQQVLPDMDHSLHGDQALDPEASCFDVSGDNGVFAGAQPPMHSPALALPAPDVPEKHRSWAPNDVINVAEGLAAELSWNQSIAATPLGAEFDHINFDRQPIDEAYLDERMLEFHRLARDLEQPAQEPPWISIVQEFSYYGENGQQDLAGSPIEIAFEVSSHDQALKVTAELFRDESKLVHWLEFDAVPEGGLQKLYLPPLEGCWTVQLCLRSKTGAPVGTPVRMRFFGSSPELWKMPAEVYGPMTLSDATSTCAHTDAGLCFSATSSNFDAAEQDVRAKTYDGVSGKNEVALRSDEGP